MRFRIDTPLITGKTESEKTSQITRFLIKLVERLNMMFDGVTGKAEFDALKDTLKTENEQIKSEIEANREYIDRLYSVNELGSVDKITWKK